MKVDIFCAEDERARHCFMSMFMLFKGGMVFCLDNNAIYFPLNLRSISLNFLYSIIFSDFFIYIAFINVDVTITVVIINVVIINVV